MSFKKLYLLNSMSDFYGVYYSVLNCSIDSGQYNPIEKERCDVSDISSDLFDNSIKYLMFIFQIKFQLFVLLS